MPCCPGIVLCWRGEGGGSAQDGVRVWSSNVDLYWSVNYLEVPSATLQSMSSVPVVIMQGPIVCHAAVEVSLARGTGRGTRQGETAPARLSSVLRVEMPITEKSLNFPCVAPRNRINCIKCPLQRSRTLGHHEKYKGILASSDRAGKLSAPYMFRGPC